MTNTIQDASLQMALEQAIFKHDMQMKKDIIIWGLMKTKADHFIADETIDEMASQPLEDVLASIYDGLAEEEKI